MGLRPADRFNKTILERETGGKSHEEDTGEESERLEGDQKGLGGSDGDTHPLDSVTERTAGYMPGSRERETEPNEHARIPFLSFQAGGVATPCPLRVPALPAVADRRSQTGSQRQPGDGRAFRPGIMEKGGSQE
jgi:hypothetical protein